MRANYRILVASLILFALTLGATLFAASGAAADSPVVHVVSWGDTIYSISRRYGTTPNALLFANNLRDPDFIFVGQRLLIPSSSGRVPPTTTTYVVQAGDTLFSIATRHGTTVNAVMQANGLYNYWIYVGQTLRIPGQVPQPPAPPPSPQGVHYIVRPGDYLALIAARYGSSVYAIQIANRLPNPSFIWIGQRLFIPGVSAPVNLPVVYNPPPPVYVAPVVNPPLIVYQPPAGSAPSYPVYPTAPPLTPVVSVPSPTPNPNASLWEAVLITNTIGTGPCSLAAIVVGKADWPVVVATTDGTWISEPKFTGTKPERGPYAVEFAHACTGIWRVIPLGLNIYADVKLEGGHAEVEFHPRS